MANCNKVHAGHAIAKRLGGDGGINGVFPQSPKYNMGAFRIFEDGVYKTVQKNGSADVKVQLKYPNATSKMPYEVIYTYTSGGKTKSQIFKNPNPCT